MYYFPSAHSVFPSIGDYWIDPNRTIDGDGTITNPFRTIGLGINKLSSLTLPAGRLHLNPGLYSELITIPQSVAVVFEGAVNGLVLMQGAINWTVTGSFLVPGAFASALAFRDCSPLGKITILDGSSPGVNPLVFENCFIGEIDAVSSTTASIVVNCSGISNAGFITSTPIVSSNSLSKIQTKNLIIGNNTKFDISNSELRATRVLLRNCQLNQNMFMSDIIGECYGSNWLTLNPIITFTGAAGTFDVDRYTRKRFMDAGGSVVNGVLRLID